jgi:RNA polymerase sigma-70 factor (ECF subfamily)
MVVEFARIREQSQASLRSSANLSRRAGLVGALFATTQRSLVWYLSRQTATRSDAEDAAQEAYLRLLDVAGLEPDIQRARSYLYRTATNLVRDKHRRAAARCEQWHVPFEDVELESEGVPLDRVVDAQYGIEIVCAALGELSPRPRQAFLLHVCEGLSYSRIALVLSVSKKTIERDIVMVLELCRLRLEQWRND